MTTSLPGAGRRPPHPGWCETSDGRRPSRGTLLADDLTQRGEEGIRLLGGPGRDPQPAGQADVPDEDVVLEQRAPHGGGVGEVPEQDEVGVARDRKSTRLNSSHANISYAVFCL